MPYIVVDAGHGGADNGAHYFGYREKDFNLRVATKVTKRLRNLGFTVTQLRTDDSYVGNASERGRMIAQLKPDFAVSIHVNSSGGTGALSGAEIITPLRKSAAKFEYYAKDALSWLNDYRMTFSRVSKTSEIHQRYVDPSTLRYTKTYDETDYYGIIREAWNGGVPLDIVEMFYLDNESDLYTFLNQEDAYVEAIVYALARAFDMKYDREYRQETSLETLQTQTYYRVVCGSYTNFEEARVIQQHLASYYPNVWVQPIEVKQ